MARATIEVTKFWQKIASGGVLVTVDKRGVGTLMFNESATDVNASRSSPAPGDQFNQTESKETYVRATDLGWIVLVDGAL